MAEQHRSPPADERRPADGPRWKPVTGPARTRARMVPALATAENPEQRRAPPADAGPEHDPPAGAGPGPRPDRPVRPPHGPHDLDQEVVRLKPRLSKSQGKAKRSGDDEDWPSTDWDDLSDADYWKEVASDKPLVTRTPEPRPARPDLVPGPESGRRPARPAPDPQTVIQQRPARTGSEAQTVIQQRPDLRHLAAAAGPGTGPGTGPIGAEPPRGARDPHHRGAEPRRPADDGRRGPDQRPMGALARVRAAARAPRAAARRRRVRPEFLSAPPAPPASPMAAEPGPARGRAHAGRPVPPPVPQSRPLPQPLDEDPLTSPSFPRITEDSRSFRGSRARAAPRFPIRVPTVPTRAPTALSSSPGTARPPGSTPAARSATPPPACRPPRPARRPTRGPARHRPDTPAAARSGRRRLPVH